MSLLTIMEYLLIILFAKTSPLYLLFFVVSPLYPYNVCWSLKDYSLIRKFHFVFLLILFELFVSDKQQVILQYKQILSAPLYNYIYTHNVYYIRNEKVKLIDNILWKEIQYVSFFLYNFHFLFHLILKPTNQ